MSAQRPPDEDAPKLISRRPRGPDGNVIPIDAPMDPFLLALHDDVLSGWFNADSRELAPHFPVTAQDVVADVGCGEGGMSMFCSRMGARVIMIDNDAEILAQAVHAAATVGTGQIEGREGVVETLPLEDAAASRVICCEVLEHVEDPASALRELVRVGRPGALYLFTVPGAASERLMRGVAPPHYFQRPNHVRIFEADELAALVEEAGLVIEGRFAYGFFWTLYWLFFFGAGIEFGRKSDPVLDAWTRTWKEMIESGRAPAIRAALHELAPRSIGIVARKPG